MPWTKRKTKRLILASDLDALLDTFILDGDSRYFPKDLVSSIKCVLLFAQDILSSSRSSIFAP